MFIAKCTFFIAVDIELLSFGIEVAAGNFPCLIQGSNVTMTCSILGFPRPPAVVFRKNSIIINPGIGEFTKIARISFNQVHACTKFSVQNYFRKVLFKK